MADNLEVSEGSSGKDVRTVEESSNLHVPLNALYADDGNGSWGDVHRRQNSLQSAIEHWNAGQIGISSLPTPVRVDATQDGDLPVTLGAESVTIGSQSAGLAQETTLSSVLFQLQSALDVSGATVTVTDNGAFNVTIDSESAGLAQQATLQTAAQVLSNAEDADGDAFDVNVTNSLGQISGDTGHDTADSGNPVKQGFKAHTSQPAPVADGDRVNAQANEYGVQYVRDLEAIVASENSIEAVAAADTVMYGGSQYTLQQAHIDVATSGVNQIVAAPGTGTRIVVLSWEVATDTAHAVTLQDGAGTPNVLDKVYAAANSGKVCDPTGPVGETADNVALNANLGGANNTSVRVSYITV